MNQVIACIDTFNHTAETVCDYANWASVQMQAPLTLLHVLEKNETPAKANLSGSIGLGAREHLLEELSSLDEQRSKILREQGRLLLEEAKKRVDVTAIPALETLQRHGDLIENLLDLEASTRLLVMGREGSHAHETSYIGSHLESVIRTVQRPILISVSDFKAPSRFMIAYDASPTAKKVLERVAASPLLKGIPCFLLMVGAKTDTQLEQLSEAKLALEKAGFTVETDIRAGEVDSVIHETLKDVGADLLVMGAYGHSRIRQFLVGSTTTKLLRSAQVPLLLLR